METDKSTSSEIIEGLEINLRNLSLKAGRMNRKDFRAFLFFATSIVLIGIVGAVFIVKYEVFLTNVRKTALVNYAFSFEA